MNPAEEPIADGPDARDVAVVGGGPAGMTAALLLARAGHRVTLYERSGQIGGLWASQLDEDGYFRSDNSCKVFQPNYTTTPALFRLIGADWRSHFIPRYDLTRDWLRPFIADCSWRDRAALSASYLLHRAGGGRFHEVSVADFIGARGLSPACEAWMCATALGGIAGTLRMTMWEFFHRVGGNAAELMWGAPGVLYWNARPPNAPGGFIDRWREALVASGVALRVGAGVTSLGARAGSRGAVLTVDGQPPHAADAVLIATPPPALARLLEASAPCFSEGFGGARGGLGGFLRESVYTHVGVSWFFDRELPESLPLGGNNVRRGWHPILVEHDQYRDYLRPPARSVVVGSLAVDTTARHHRLGTLARQHSLDELAAILWDDERRVVPALPEPIDVVITASSSATQIVSRGPLPVASGDRDVFLATNLHGQAPYFTASLEAAIQAGAIAARRYDPSVEGLPMGRPNRLPWHSAAPKRAVGRLRPALSQVGSNATD